MRIAVTYDNGMIYTHYSRTPALKIYQVVGNRITDTEFIQVRGFIRNNEVDNMLRRYNIDVLICDRIGVAARIVVAASGVKIVDRQRGSADHAVANYLGIPFMPPAPKPSPRPSWHSRSFAQPRANKPKMAPAPKPITPPKPVAPSKPVPPPKPAMAPKSKPAPLGKGPSVQPSRPAGRPAGAGMPSTRGNQSSRGGGFRK